MEGKGNCFLHSLTPVAQSVYLLKMQLEVASYPDLRTFPQKQVTAQLMFDKLDFLNLSDII